MYIVPIYRYEYMMTILWYKKMIANVKKMQLRNRKNINFYMRFYKRHVYKCHIVIKTKRDWYEQKAKSLLDMKL